MKKIFEGSCTALITPFKKGRIDFNKLENMLEFQIASGVDALLLLGTTGEASTITPDERTEILNFSKKIINGRVKFLAGTGSNNTRTARDLTMQAKKIGVDGVLIVTPYYNKCTQKGIIEHYKTIANCVDVPIILYNVPSRTGVNIKPETAKELSKITNIVGIKEANSDLEHITEMINMLQNEMAVYSGNDDLNFEFLASKGQGIISVTGNIFPDLTSLMCNLFKKGEVVEAYNIHKKLQGVNKALFLETNPIPVKFASSKMELCENELRLPLTPLDKEFENKILVEIEKVKQL